MNSPRSFCLSLFNSCKSLTFLKQIHASLLKFGLDTDPFFVGKLLLHCTPPLFDSLDYAVRVFTHTPDPDVFMYNTLIRGFAESENPQSSIFTFIEMRRNSDSFPDSFSFAFVLKAAANLRSLTSGIQLHSQALRHGLDTHVFVGTTLVSMYGECGHAGLASKVLEEMLEPNVVAWNALITAFFRGEDMKGAETIFASMPLRNLTSWNLMLAGYVKVGELELAKQMFSDMPAKDDVSWSTMIVGFAHNGCFDEAFGFFRDSQREGRRPSEVSMTGVLSACAQGGAFEFGKILHGFIEKAGHIWIISVNNALLDTYAKCGNIGMAQLIFERIPDKRSIVSWTSMMAALAMHGHGEEAIKLFQEMEESGTRPDGITFISLLYACSHAGLVEQGRKHFNQMEHVYNIKPSLEHYGCVVDLYGRAGQLQEACEFVSRMPIPPNDVIWRILLGACSIHGNVKLAELVKERLAELDPHNSSDRVLLSNVYAVAGKWKDAASVRRSMTSLRVRKTPGWSMIEVDKVMYTFVAGAKLDNVTEEALREIICRLKDEAGYVPETGNALHDVEVEEKEDSVSMHSEKLAVAFGISRLCRGKVIRIFKNLRICRDCHAMMKLISKVFEVEIVVRDRSRFHSFKLGFCSCRDYW